MKVIIMKDTPKVGKKDEVKDFPDGYVRNMLIPKGIATIATPALLQEIENRKSHIRVQKEIQNDLLEKNLRALKEVTLHISRKANEQGHLFSSIHAKDICFELKEQLHIEISEKSIKISEPYKTIGTFIVPVEIVGKHSQFSLIIDALK